MERLLLCLVLNFFLFFRDVLLWLLFNNFSNFNFKPVFEWIVYQGHWCFIFLEGRPMMFFFLFLKEGQWCYSMMTIKLNWSQYTYKIFMLIRRKEYINTSLVFKFNIWNKNFTSPHFRILLLIRWKVEYWNISMLVVKLIFFSSSCKLELAVTSNFFN